MLLPPADPELSLTFIVPYFLLYDLHMHYHTQVERHNSMSLLQYSMYAAKRTSLRNAAGIAEHALEERKWLATAPSLWPYGSRFSHVITRSLCLSSLPPLAVGSGSHILKILLALFAIRTPLQSRTRADNSEQNFIQFFEKVCLLRTHIVTLTVPRSQEVDEPGTPEPLGVPLTPDAQSRRTERSRVGTRSL